MKQPCIHRNLPAVICGGFFPLGRSASQQAAVYFGRFQSAQWAVSARTACSSASARTAARAIRSAASASVLRDGKVSETEPSFSEKFQSGYNTTVFVNDKWTDG